MALPEQQPIRLWGDEGTPRAIEPQTPGEQIKFAADQLSGLLSTHLRHASSLERGGNAAIAREIKGAMARLERTWLEVAEEQDNTAVASILKGETVADRLQDPAVELTDYLGLPREEGSEALWEAARDSMPVEFWGEMTEPPKGD